MKYESIIVHLSNESDFHTSVNFNRENQLNSLGAEEWELKSIYNDSGNLYAVMSKPVIQAKG